jgi:hypothetical protein
MKLLFLFWLIFNSNWFSFLLIFISLLFLFVACLELDFKENELDMLLYKDHLLPLHSVFQNNLSTSLSLPFCTPSPAHARHTQSQSQSQSLPLSLPLPTAQEAFLALRTLVDAGAVSKLFGRHYALLELSYIVHRNYFTFIYVCVWSSIFFFNYSSVYLISNRFPLCLAK